MHGYEGKVVCAEVMGKFLPLCSLWFIHIETTYEEPWPSETNSIKGARWGHVIKDTFLLSSGATIDSRNRPCDKLCAMGRSLAGMLSGGSYVSRTTMRKAVDRAKSAV